MKHPKLVMLAIGTLLPIMLCSLAQPQAPANGTTIQTCNNQAVAGSSCTVSSTVTPTPTGVDTPCSTVKITGTITCGDNSCPFEFEVCSDSSDAIEFMCDGGTYKGTVPANSNWGGSSNRGREV